MVGVIGLVLDLTSVTAVVLSVDVINSGLLFDRSPYGFADDCVDSTAD